MFRKFATASSLTGSALAQSSNSSFEGCPSAIRDVADGRLYNSTGTLPITFVTQRQDWQISVAIRDTRAENLVYGDEESEQYMSLFISVPRSVPKNETLVCAYMMHGVNETVGNSTNAGKSCDGILSNECIKKIERMTIPREGECPRFDISEECGENYYRSHPIPLNLSSNCTIDSLPNIDIPDYYNTYGSVLSGGFMPADRDRESFDFYDLRVQQTIPFLFSVQSPMRNGAAGQTKAVCITPNNVLPNSRKPELDISGGMSLRSGAFGIGGLMAVGAVVIFGVL